MWSRQIPPGQMLEAREEQECGGDPPLLWHKELDQILQHLRHLTNWAMRTLSRGKSNCSFNYFKVTPFYARYLFHRTLVKFVVLEQNVFMFHFYIIFRARFRLRIFFQETVKLSVAHSSQLFNLIFRPNIKIQGSNLKV